MPPKETKSQSLGDRLQGHLRQLLKAEKRLSKKKREIRSVHQIRVLSRRIEATLNLFSENGKDWTQRIGKQTKQLRKSLRDVREMDVFQSLLASLAVSPGVSESIGSLFKKRRRKALDKAWSKLKKRRVKEWMQETEKTLSKPQKPALHQKMIESQALRLTNKILKERQDLHRMRIDVKQLRYSLEALVGLLNQQDGNHLKVLKTIQKDLGQIHDVEMLRDYLKGLENKKQDQWNPKTLQEVRKLIQRLNSRIRMERRGWEQHWPEHRQFLVKMSQELKKGNNR